MSWLVTFDIVLLLSLLLQVYIYIYSKLNHSFLSFPLHFSMSLLEPKIMPYFVSFCFLFYFPVS